MGCTSVNRKRSYKSTLSTSSFHANFDLVAKNDSSYAIVKFQTCWIEWQSRDYYDCRGTVLYHAFTNGHKYTSKWNINFEYIFVSILPMTFSTRVNISCFSCCILLALYWRYNMAAHRTRPTKNKGIAQTNSYNHYCSNSNIYLSKEHAVCTHLRTQTRNPDQ